MSHTSAVDPAACQIYYLFGLQSSSLSALFKRD